LSLAYLGFVLENKHYIYSAFFQAKSVIVFKTSIHAPSRPHLDLSRGYGFVPGHVGPLLLTVVMASEKADS
jgi:hypothetical protein